MPGLDYWRARIRAILALPLLPIQLEEQAKNLLGRQDHLENPRLSVCTGAILKRAQIMRAQMQT